MLSCIFREGQVCIKLRHIIDNLANRPVTRIYLIKLSVVVVYQLGSLLNDERIYYFLSVSKPFVVNTP